MNNNRIPVNNGIYKRITPIENALVIHTEDENGGLLKPLEVISGGDFITLLNWYAYQKANGNEQLIF